MFLKILSHRSLLILEVSATYQLEGGGEEEYPASKGMGDLGKTF